MASFLVLACSTASWAAFRASSMIWLARSSAVMSSTFTVSMAPWVVVSTATTSLSSAPNSLVGAAAVLVAGALVLGGNAQNYLIEALISGVLVGQRGCRRGQSWPGDSRARSGAQPFPGAVGRLGLLLAAGACRRLHTCPKRGPEPDALLHRFHQRSLHCRTIPLAHLIALAGGGAGGGFNHPAGLEDDGPGQDGLLHSPPLPPCGSPAAALADLVLFSGSGAGSLHHDPITHVVV